ncbi:MAG TPA: nicotinate-nucleotide--dimethylbenzimidazole phosphoribosyltransferase, partial [Pseudomonadales bacterium]|nr:nicotinate-nucleotide--dimethylbenzimidazole phosphoribosyltransferase [Pseudomonadales bacterium]
MSLWLNNPVKIPSAQHQQNAAERQAVLTKPAGSLGVLEDIAIRLAGLQANDQPQIKTPYISIFAGDHGIAEEGVSAFPQAVTAEMIRNFSRGGAAISVLAKQISAHFEVINCGTVNELETLPHVINARIAAGTRNFAKQDAMTQAQFEAALDIGRNAVQRAQAAQADVWIGG